MSFEVKKEAWSQDLTALHDGESWSKWSDATGLEKLLMAESLARPMNGMIEFGFPGRQRSRSEREEGLKFELKPNPARMGDYYGGGGRRDKNGDTVWPATTRLLEVEKGGKWRIEWKEGNMPRKPKSWEEWSKTAYVSDTPRNSGRYHYDYAKMRKEREEREKREKEAAEKKRLDEINQARAEARADADAERVRAMASSDAEVAAAKEKATAAKEAARSAAAALKKEKAALRAVVAEKTAQEATFAMLNREREGLEQQVRQQSERLEQRDDREVDESKLCIVCLDEEKSVMLEPCRHVCLCVKCEAAVELCPLCRAKPTSRVRLYI